MTFSIKLREIARNLFGSPVHDQLANFIGAAWADLDHEIHSGGPSVLSEPWARSAYLLLLRPEADLASWRIERGWDFALAAQRAIISNPHNPKRIERVAIALHREADKIVGWRAKAIQDLICDPKGNLITVGPNELMRVVDAVALRDDFSQNTWFKILLRRRHLFSLFILLWAAISLCLILSWLGILPGFLADARQLSVVTLFGVLGAAISVAQSLVAQDVSARIPAQQMGSFLVWMRPAIGATVALVVLALLQANNQFHLLGNYSTDQAVIVVFSFVAGYSERFIVGTVERISSSAVKTKPD